MPQQSPNNRSRSMPLLLMAGLLIVMGVGLQVIRLTVVSAPEVRDDGVAVLKQEILKETPPAPKVSETSNVFENLHTQYPHYQKEQKKAQELAKPKRVSVPYLPHNPVWGQHDATVELTVFVDHNCDACRSKLRSLFQEMAPYKSRLRIVMKFAPQQEKEVSAGLFEQMARREGVHSVYLQNVLAKQFMSSEAYFLLLEEAGVPLSRQREMMTDDLRSISRDLQLDIDLFKRVEKQDENADGFVLYLNGYRIGKAGLHDDDLPILIEQFLQGQGLQG